MGLAAARSDASEGAALREPKGPPGHWLLGHSRQIERDALGALMRAFRDHGDVVALRFGPVRACLLAHPDHIQHVLQKNHRNYDKNVFSYRRLKALLGDGLVTSDGALWQRQHDAAQPAFQRRRLDGVVGISARAAEEIALEWRTKAARGEPTDVHQDMMRVALQVAADALFGADLRAEADRVGRALGIALDEVVRRVYATVPLPRILPTAANRRLNAALAELHVIVGRVIERRRTMADPRDDLLSMLLADADPGDPLAERRLRDQVITFLLAGHETTANALTWTFHLLGRHPEVARRLRAELSGILAGRPPDNADLPRLEYTRMVLEEALRLFPPVWVVDRRAIEDDAIGGHRIRAGTLVMASQYVTHRHPAFWPDPERFDPERFAPEAVRARPRFAYFPFAGGPRMCIGSHLAMIETTTVLACLAQHFEASPVPGQPVELNPSVTLRPRHGVPMFVQPIR